MNLILQAAERGGSNDTGGTTLREKFGYTPGPGLGLVLGRGPPARAWERLSVDRCVASNSIPPEEDPGFLCYPT
jgi:hypothetical protein